MLAFQDDGSTLFFVKNYHRTISMLHITGKRDSYLTPITRVSTSNL